MMCVEGLVTFCKWLQVGLIAINVIGDAASAVLIESIVDGFVGELVFKNH